jgi:hypothetical protein
MNHILDTVVFAKMWLQDRFSGFFELELKECEILMNGYQKEFFHLSFDFCLISLNVS